MAVKKKTHYALLPLSWIYRMVIGIRNKLFDWKILPAEEFSVPVISIGNLTVGGTGKTPHTEFLIRTLSSRHRIAVLSRGYKRKTKGFVLADKQSTPYTIGDEPYQMFSKFPRVLVAVDADRRNGIRKLLALPEDKRPEIILLDDAFQHRYVTPSLSILLTDNNNPIYEDKMLPAGRLREPFKNKARAQIVIVTKCPTRLQPIEYRVIMKNLNLPPYQSLYFTSIQYGDITPLRPTFDLFERKSLMDIQLEETAVLLVAGIASNKALKEELKKHTPDLRICSFSDHHEYSEKDQTEILRLYDEIPTDNKILLTTEKDAVKLNNDPNLNNRLKELIYYIPIKVVFHLDQRNAFIQNIENHVKEFKRNRSLAQALNPNKN